jgi:hypothetical protein
MLADIDFLKLSSRTDKDQESLYLIAKEGVQKESREEYYEKIQSINKYIIGNFLLSEPLLSSLRRELRKFAEGLKIEVEELEGIIKNEIIKREILDSEDGEKASSKVKRYLRKIAKRQKKTNEEPKLEEKGTQDSTTGHFKPPTE